MVERVLNLLPQVHVTVMSLVFGMDAGFHGNLVLL